MNDEQKLGGPRPAGEPQGYFVVVPPSTEEDKFEFARFVRNVFAAWKGVVIGGFLGGVFTAVWAMQLPLLYRSQALIAPVENNTGLAGSLRNQFGGLAALAGVDIGATASRKEEAFAMLSSQGFARDFIVAENLLPVLFADRWDAKAKKWRPGENEPTLEDGMMLFTRDVRSITEERRTGLITVTVVWESPELAARWANRLVDLANERLRREAREQSERSIQYLNNELAKTSVVELRQSIFRLIETQVNNAMLANVQIEYAFRIIDRAVPSEKRFSPRRTLMTLLGTFAGALLGVGIFLMRRAWQRGKGALPQA
jgi:uncharacterized protein involved in exopolysaccharide biosynthesis